MPQKYIIEKSTSKRNYYEIWKKNQKKGYYNFIDYISGEEIETFKNMHKKDEVVIKSPTF